MKKSTCIVASLLLAVTGCGRGWLPCLHRGDTCMNHCAPAAAPLAHADCNTCPNTAAMYDGYVTDGGAYSTITNPAVSAP